MFKQYYLRKGLVQEEVPKELTSLGVPNILEHIDHVTFCLPTMDEILMAIPELRDFLENPPNHDVEYTNLKKLL